MKKIVLLFLSGFLLLSCSKSRIPSNSDPAMQDLVIPSDFDFSSTKDIDLDISLPSHIDYTNQRSKIEIYYELNEKRYLVSKVTSTNRGKYVGTIRVPSYVNNIVIKNEAGEYIYSLETQGLKSAIVFDYDTDYYNEEPPTKSIAKSLALKSGDIINYSTTVKSLPNLKAVANIIGNGTFDSDDFGSISQWHSPLIIDKKWYVTSQLSGNVSQGDDNGNKFLKIKNTSSSFRYGGVAQLVNASPNDRITFSADVKLIGSGTKRAYLYIIPRNINGSALRFYSRTITNTGNKWKNYSVVATMPAGTVSCEILLWNHMYGGENHYDNVIVTGPIEDFDKDGVNDEDDEYPKDPERAYNVYYPSKTTYSSIAFEDNWPGKGDYDFNDLVVDYQFKQVVNASNALKDLYINLIYQAAGASLENGFGFEFNTPSTNVTEVIGQTRTKNYINLIGANKPEAEQDKATIIATDNVFNKLTHPGSGTGINTSPNAPYVTPVSQTVKVVFKKAVKDSKIGLPPYNPFMIVNGDRGREIHLPDQKPTTLANEALFGTEHDDTGGNKYYKTAKNLPWAINIPVSFAYTNERTEIIKAHLKFKEWAESSGSLFTDWYLDLSGYRNASNVYKH
jgi:LruC domain-containing protein